GDFAAIETRARRIVEHMALALQGSLLVRHGDPAVADAFLSSRLAGVHGLAFGTLPAGVDFVRFIERARPAVGRSMASVSGAVLITGCSTGSGRASGRQVSARACGGCAGAPRPASIRGLAGRGWQGPPGG